VTVETLIALINFSFIGQWCNFSKKKKRRRAILSTEAHRNLNLFFSAWVSLKCQSEFVAGQCVSDLFGWGHSLLSWVCQSQQLLSKYLQCVSADEVIRTLMTQPQAGQVVHTINKHTFPWAEDSHIFTHNNKSTSFTCFLKYACIHTHTTALPLAFGLFSWGTLIKRYIKKGDLTW